MLAAGSVGLEFDIHEELSEKELAAHAGDDELVVLADEAEARLHGPVAFQDRGAVGEGTERNPLQTSPRGGFNLSPSGELVGGYFLCQLI